MRDAAEKADLYSRCSPCVAHTPLIKTVHSRMQSSAPGASVVAWQNSKPAHLSGECGCGAQRNQLLSTGLPKARTSCPPQRAPGGPITGHSVPGCEGSVTFAGSARVSSSLASRQHLDSHLSTVVLCGPCAVPPLCGSRALLDQLLSLPSTGATGPALEKAPCHHV